jgi:hypothetical protein
MYFKWRSKIIDPISFSSYFSSPHSNKFLSPPVLVPACNFPFIYIHIYIYIYIYIYGERERVRLDNHRPKSKHPALSTTGVISKKRKLLKTRSDRSSMQTYINKGVRIGLKSSYICMKRSTVLLHLVSSFNRHGIFK